MMIVQIQNVPINNRPIPVDESTDLDWIGPPCKVYINHSVVCMTLQFAAFPILQLSTPQLNQAAQIAANSNNYTAPSSTVGFRAISVFAEHMVQIGVEEFI